MTYLCSRDVVEAVVEDSRNSFKMSLDLGDLARTELCYESGQGPYVIQDLMG